MASHEEILELAAKDGSIDVYASEAAISRFSLINIAVRSGLKS